MTIRICCAVYEELQSQVINPESINIDEGPRRLYEGNASVHQFQRNSLTGPRIQISLLHKGTVHKLICNQSAKSAHCLP